MNDKQVHIPEGWEVYKLGATCNIKKGVQFSKVDLSNSGQYPCINGGIEPSGYSELWNTQENTITISEGGNSCGYVNFITTKFWSGGHCYSLLDLSENLENDFLYQALKGRQDLIMDLRVGSGLPNIQQKAIKEFSFLAPKSKTEQTQIATILSKVDDAITQTKQLIAKYTRIKTGVMQDLLTKGIDENGNIRSEATHEFKDSPLGRIPKEWECMPIEDLADLKSGGTPSRQNSTLWNGTIPWVKTGEVDYNVIYSTEETITEKGLKLSSASLFPQSTILMALYGQGKTRGRVAILGTKASTNQACLGFLNLRKVTTKFLFATLTYEYEKLRDLSNDGAQKNLSGNLLKKYLLKIPLDTKEQQKIDLVFEKIDLSLKEQKLQLSKLQSLKTGLMQDLLSGKVRVNHLIKEKASV